MLVLTKKFENRFPEFDLIPQHLGKVISYVKFKILKSSILLWKIQFCIKNSR